jgi:hypothetical protein
MHRLLFYLKMRLFERFRPAPPGSLRVPGAQVEIFVIKVSCIEPYRSAGAELPLLTHV